MNIAFCSSEIYPFAKTGGMADVCGALPLALEKIGENLFLFLPKYKGIDKDFKLTKIDDELYETKLGENIRVFLVEHNGYFDRDGFYGDENGDFEDNLDRYQFFCEQFFKVCQKQKLEIDIVHCHDWQAALIPIYLKENYANDPLFKKTKSVLTIHNLAYQGLFPKGEFDKLALDKSLFDPQALEFHDQIGLLKGGLIYSDVVNTVSPQYAKEILTKELGFGLEDVLEARANKAKGILNGVDYSVWSPKTDPYLYLNFSSDNITEGKLQNKIALQKSVDLPVLEHVPVFGMVGRLSHQKGLELLIEALPGLLSLEAQFVIQGVGDPDFEAALKKIAKAHSDKISVQCSFDESLAHKIYGGADMFLMPSNFEPCGLSQIIAMAYGTLPIVYSTGGLVDTIIRYKKSGGHANGFAFDKYTPNSFVKIVEEAVTVYKDKGLLNQLRMTAIESDFSWDTSAQKYLKMYACLQSD